MGSTVHAREGDCPGSRWLGQERSTEGSSTCRTCCVRREQVSRVFGEGIPPLMAPPP